MASPDEVTVKILTAPDATPNGAGWLLSDGDVLTCAHVVAGCAKVWIGTLGTTRRTYEYYVHHADPPQRNRSDDPFEGDLALLKPVAAGQSARPGKEYRPRPPRQGESVVAFGFPSHYPSGLSGYGRVGTGSSVGRYEILQPERDEHILLKGFSGAPIASTERPNILGLFASTVGKTARGYLIPPRFIGDWLQRIGEAKHVVPRNADTSIPNTAHIRRVVFGESSPEVGFDIRVRQLANDGDLSEALARIPHDYDSDDLTPEEFVSQLDASGASTLIRARGGGGKSTFLVDVAGELEAAGISYLWLDLKKLKARERGATLTLTLDELSSRPDELMNRLCTPACEVSGWGEKLNSGNQLVVIADGVNEVGKDAARLLEALEQHARYRADTRLIATARTTTELRPREDTRVFVVTPVADRVVASATGRTVGGWNSRLRAFLANPQMLSLAVATQSFGDVPRSEMFGRYFASVFAKARRSRPGTWLEKAPDNFLNALLERLSFDLLHNRGAALAISESDWNAHLSRALSRVLTRKSNDSLDISTTEEVSILTDELIEQGVVTRALGEVALISFQHPLYQEWLAATYFVRLPLDSWTNAGFTAITLEDSSDDGLRLALEQLTGVYLNLFLQTMYDWRWERVMALLAQGVDGVAAEVRDAFIGINAIRLLDPFKHTRTAVEVPLRRLADAGDQFATSLLDAAKSGSEEDLWEHVHARFKDVDFSTAELKPFATWDSLFALAEPAGIDSVTLLVMPFPFVGWSASNVLRRTGLTEEACEAAILAFMASLTSTQSASAEEFPPNFAPSEIGVGVRWRLVHTLGRGVPEDLIPTAIYFLLQVWNNEHEHRDVRFGACRSLMEIALTYPSERPGILSSMSNVITKWGDTAGADRKWRDSAYKASEQLWVAWEPAEGVLDDSSLAQWRVAFREILAVVKKTATAMDWRSDGLDAAIEFLWEEEPD